MDWALAIEKNRDALKRVLAMLVAMIEAAGGGASGLSDCGARQTTLPRHLHRFVLRLLRPAEAAARRLIIIAARGLVVKLPPLRLPKPGPQPRTIFTPDRVRGSSVSVPIVLPQPARSAVPPRRAHRIALAARPAQTFRRPPSLREAQHDAEHQVLRRSARTPIPTAATAESASAVAR